MFAEVCFIRKQYALSRIWSLSSTALFSSSSSDIGFSFIGRSLMYSMMITSVRTVVWKNCRRTGSSGLCGSFGE